MSSLCDAAEELRLPQTVIYRLVKDALPPGVIVSKEARTAIARAAAVFILHASTYAQDCAVSNKRKTVTAADVLSAMRTLECDELIEPIKEAVEVWKSNKQQKLDDARKRKAEREKQASEASAAVSKEEISEPVAKAPVSTEAPSESIVEEHHDGDESMELDYANDKMHQNETNERLSD